MWSPYEWLNHNLKNRIGLNSSTENQTFNQSNENYKSDSLTEKTTSSTGKNLPQGTSLPSPTTNKDIENWIVLDHDGS